MNKEQWVWSGTPTRSLESGHPHQDPSGWVFYPHGGGEGDDVRQEEGGGKEVQSEEYSDREGICPNQNQEILEIFLGLWGEQQEEVGGDLGGQKELCQQAEEGGVVLIGIMNKHGKIAFLIIDLLFSQKALSFYFGPSEVCATSGVT